MNLMIMSPATRRVRRLRLTSPTAAAARRGERLFADALRTASAPLPAAAGSRLLLIRRLSLPAIDSRRGPTPISLALGQRLREASGTAVHALSPAAPTSTAVYFDDDLEPAAALARLVLHLRSPRGWFWPLAVTGFQPALPRPDTLRLAWRTALAAGPAGILRLWAAVRPLGEAAAGDLLAVLEPADGAALWRVWGYPPPSPRLTVRPPVSPLSPGETPLATPTPWTPAGQDRDLLALWAARWGTTDGRTAWLAALLLVAERAGRALDPALPGRAAALVNSVAALSPQEHISGRSSRPGPKSTAPADVQIQGATRTDIPHRPDQVPSSNDDGQRERHPAFLPEDRSAKGASSSEPSGHAAWIEAEGAPAPAPDDRGGMAMASGHAAWIGAEDAAAPASDDRGGMVTASGRDRHARPGLPTTGIGGLLFLPAVFTRLGFDRFLQAQPHWLELLLAERLLRELAGRVGPVDLELDPLLAALPPVPVGPPPHAPFAVPALWAEGIWQEGNWQTRPYFLEPGVRGTSLWDGSGRLPLAAWAGRQPAAVTGLLAGRPTRPGEPVNEKEDKTGPLAVQAWVTAARRWCRRFAGIGLLDLIRRPALVQATPTHIDLFFDLRQVDIRLRRTGLDLNLGWIPWLGRVVTFYYVDADEPPGDLIDLEKKDDRP